MKIVESKDCKKIVGLEDYYITSSGDVYSTKNNMPIKRKLFSCKDNPYSRVSLYKKGKRKTYLVHRLVFDHFSKEPMKKGNMIDHIDRDKLNNHISNLRQVNNRENRVNSDYMDNAKKYWFDKRREMYICHLVYYGKKIFLGRSKDPSLLVKRYDLVMKKSMELSKEDFFSFLALFKKQMRLENVKGYYYSNNRNRYVAQIVLDKTVYLGSFETAEEARSAYVKKFNEVYSNGKYYV